MVVQWFIIHNGKSMKILLKWDDLEVPSIGDLDIFRVKAQKGCPQDARRLCNTHTCSCGECLRSDPCDME